MMAVGATLVADVEALASRIEAWDRLAVTARRPYSAPGWVLAWWEQMPVRRSLLRAVVIEDGAELIGIALFQSRDGEYSLIGCDYASNVEPLAAPGREADVAAAIAEALAAAGPALRRLRLPQQGGDPDWATLLVDAWPGRLPWRRASDVESCPWVDVAGLDYETWLNGRSRNFRQTIRRRRRQLDRDGGRYRVATLDTVERDVGELMRLHRERLDGRGGTLLTDPRVEAVLVSAGRALIPAGRFRLLTIELGGRAIGAQLFLIAGDEVSYWNGGFDEAQGKYSPSMLGLADAIDLACELGGSLNLGAGAQEYKRRFAEEDRQLTSHLILARGHGYRRSRLLEGLRSAARRIG